jgi:hypothetical protein
LLKKGLEQTADYAVRCQSTEAHLLIFDRDGFQNWRAEPKTEPEQTEHEGIKITIWKLW